MLINSIADAIRAQHFPKWEVVNYMISMLCLCDALQLESFKLLTYV